MNKYEVTVADSSLVQWLRQQGADRYVVHDFYLSKGMGERLELRIATKDKVTLTFYGIEAAKRKALSQEQNQDHHDPLR